MSAFCYKEQVAKEATKLLGRVGMYGVNSVMMKTWLPHCCDFHLECLGEEMALWVMLLSNTSPDYAVYHALNLARELPACKCHGVCPLACNEVWMRLLGACNLTETGR